MIDETFGNQQLKAAESAGAFEHKWPYVCSLCGSTWQMSYYDIQRLTDSPVMPCGHRWEHLAYDWSQDQDPSATAQAAPESPNPVS